MISPLTEPTRIHRRVEQLMGMPVSLALRGRHARGPAAEAAWAEVVTDLRWVDRVFSLWRPDSAASRLRRGELELDGCPPEMTEVLELAQQAERESGGAFSSFLPPDDGDVAFDPTGVVKGWAVERAARFLHALDDTDFCLSAGGDMVCRVVRGDSPAWQVGIEDPRDPRRLVARVPVRDGAVATSGAAHRGPHVVDARTGRPPLGVGSVTVIGPSLTWADIDATAAYAQGPAAADWLRTRPGRTGLVAWDDGRCELVEGPVAST
ncbi:FAD:protein FMN transferase [Nocardioides sp.]|uniref:FAD:protein FMN transferase n=1 Tax=Nocardioides sp. TaxID=35761 RepID=UPI003528B9FC